MIKILIAALLLSLSLAGCTSLTPRDEHNAWPVTVSEAVDSLVNDWLSPEDIMWIGSNDKDYVVGMLHLSFGTAVRNAFGLWGENKRLLHSCVDDHAEACSGIIFEALWDRLRAELPRDEAQSLDCHFDHLKQIHIQTQGWYLLRMGEMLQDLQRQIAQHAPAADRPVCGAALMLRIEGQPDLECWIRYESEQMITLGQLLGWISWRNGFSVTHAPPEIVLSFAEPCSWSERPTHFAPKPLPRG